MELQEFVSKTLVDIAKGIDDANKKISDLNGDTKNSIYFKTRYQDDTIKFNLNVNVIEENNSSNSKEGGSRINVVSLGGSKSKENNIKAQQTQSIEFDIRLANSDFEFVIV